MYAVAISNAMSHTALAVILLLYHDPAGNSSDAIRIFTGYWSDSMVYNHHMAVPGVHPIAACFPMLQGAEREKLLNSIKDHGLRLPVVLHPDGRILDGRNRWECCDELGVTPSSTVYSGSLDDTSLVAYVTDVNDRRRHLSVAERAVVAAKLADLKQGSSPGTQGGGAVTHGNDEVSADNSSSLPVTNQPSRVTLQDAANALGIGKATAARAKAVYDSGHGGIFSHLERGNLSIEGAYDLSRPGNTELTSAADQGTADDAKAALAELRRRKKETRDAQRKLIQAEERRLLDELVSPADREAYRQELSKSPSQRDQSRTSVPLPTTTDEDESLLASLAHESVIASLLGVLSSTAVTVKGIIDNRLKEELLTPANRTVISERIRMLRVHLDYLEALGDDAFGEKP